MLDGAHKGGQLGRCEIRQSWDDTRGYDEDVFGWISTRDGG